MRRHLAYRETTISRIFLQIEAGECCNIVGINGMGKTNLIKHMIDPIVINHYLSSEKSSTYFVVIDINLLVNSTCWGIFEGLADALVHTLGSNSDKDLTALLHNFHKNIIHAKGDDALALRTYGEMINRICQFHRLVLIFDEFDSLFTTMPESVLRHLRGLRDRYKYQLIYITLSRHPIQHLRSDEWDVVEPFVELFSLEQIGLPPLNDVDSEIEVDRYVSRYQSILDLTSRTHIITAAGGHPALLRALTHEALNKQLNPIIDDLSPILRLECAKIWNHLNGDEQDALRNISIGVPLNQQQIAMLTLKGLIHKQTDTIGVIFSSIFAIYIRQINVQSHTHMLFINPMTRQVIYYDHDISDLSPLEYKLLFYTYQRWGEVCSIHDVAEAVYAGDSIDNDYERLRVLARRLARRLRQYAPDEPCLFTIRRQHGYQLGFPLSPSAKNNL